jgi:hypothetical protein
MPEPFGPSEETIGFADLLLSSSETFLFFPGVLREVAVETICFFFRDRFFPGVSWRFLAGEGFVIQLGIPTVVGHRLDLLVIDANGLHDHSQLPLRIRSDVLRRYSIILVCLDYDIAFLRLGPFLLLALGVPLRASCSMKCNLLLAVAHTCDYGVPRSVFR